MVGVTAGQQLGRKLLCHSDLVVWKVMMFNLEVDIKSEHGKTYLQWLTKNKGKNERVQSHNQDLVCLLIFKSTA